LTLTGARFTLLESTQKKARFLKSAGESLRLRNVEVFPERAEDWLKTPAADIITARALAPLHRALPLFANSVKRGARVLFYKGPDVEQEIAEAASHKWRLRIVYSYELPDAMGTRHIVEMSH
jgi:16S rRNA (guanine527-N7)-methyltransferase